MTRRIFSVFIIMLFLAGCGQLNFNQAPTGTSPWIPIVASDTPTVALKSTSTPTITPSFTPTATKTAAPTKTTTPAIYGPTNFPANIDPLTGQAVSDPSLLDRRPIAIKVNIVPRTWNRPPWGLSFADIVFDYYHNDGYSRFHAIFLGKDASLVGPIRSGRMLDYELVHMYSSIFSYGSADALINQRLLNSDFADRIILEGSMVGCPPTDRNPLCRFEPNTNDILLGSTSALSADITSRGVSNGRQNLDGMLFDPAAPSGGDQGEQLFVRYSGDNYTRWDYDSSTGLYLRFQDNIYDTGQGEEYAPLTDRLNDEQFSASNVVVILARHDYYQQPPAEIVEITLSGNGAAYAFRDGQVYQVQWSRPTTNSVLTLTTSDGKPFPYKPGATWYQVVGSTTIADQEDSGAWRFNFSFP